MASNALATLNRLYRQPEACAAAIGLRYLHDDVPGFGRRRCGKGFVYLDTAGRPLRNPQLRHRCEQLAIPPAWKRVWISPRPDAHLQATGYDEAGRKQYLYHADWQDFRNRLKFYHLIPFSSCLPRLRRKATTVLRDGDPGQAETLLAAMVLLLDKAALRIGNEVYFDHNESVGLSTLLPEHLQLEGARMLLRYTGKAGQAQCITLEDAQLAAVLDFLQRQAGPRLFCYRDGEGHFCPVSADAVNHYLQTLSPCEISAKDFRTWKGTLLAFEQMLGNPESTLKQIVETVAEALGNTPAVAQGSYIHPELLALWRSGEFAAISRQLTAYRAKAYFSRSEHRLQQLLMRLFQRHMRQELPRAV